MIAVILDSNSLYGDPFLNSGNLKRLVAYSLLDKLDILISEVVIEEVNNNNTNKIKTTFEKVKGQLKTINETSGTQQLSVTNIDIDVLVNDLKNRFCELSSKNAITRIPYKNDILPVLVNRALNKIMPFKENKEAFRDSVIWLSTVDYLKSNTYEKAFFISNNSSDFSDPKTGTLHQDLINDYSNIKLYKNLKDFFLDEKEIIERLIPGDTSSDLMIWAAENQPEEKDVYDHLRKYFFDDLKEKVSQVLSAVSVHELADDIFDGYVQPYELDDFYIDNFEVDIDLDAIIVTGQCVTSDYVEIYQYNPVHDSSDEKFSCAGDAEIEVIIDFMFYISPDEEEPYDFDITSTKVNIT